MTYKLEDVTEAKVFVHTWIDELSMMEDFNDKKGVVDTIIGVLTDAQYNAVNTHETLVALVEWFASLKTVEDIQKDIDSMEGLPCPTMEQTLKAIHIMCINKATETLNKIKGE